MTNNHAHERLHELFENDPLGETELRPEEQSALDASNTDERDDTNDLDVVLSMATLSALSPEAQSLLIELTETSSSLEPATRERLIKAADRGLKRRREDASPLPRLLFVVRNRDHLTLDAVAASLSADDELLAMVERGERSLEELGAKTVASWIEHLHLNKDDAIQALRLAFLTADADTDQAAAGVSVELSAQHNDFVNEVAALLEG